MAGVLSGVMAERERRQKAELQRTTNRLAEVYQKLQDNFERLRRAERLSALGQLSAGLAHEVRNPVASIAGAAGLLRKNLRLESKEAECLAIIVKECKRLEALLTHFLAFARPRTPKFRPADLGALVDTVMSLAAHSQGEKRVTLRTAIDPNVKEIECDPDLLKQLLLNLVLNAIQATDAGEVLVSAQLRDDRVHLKVTDQGCGINPKIREQIFDPFFTTKDTGTGLGLSVAHQIAEQHNAMLTAEANEGKGTTFSLFLLRHHKSSYVAK
jgi:signal transduction histidine kinase